MKFKYQTSICLFLCYLETRNDEIWLTIDAFFELALKKA